MSGLRLALFVVVVLVALASVLVWIAHPAWALECLGGLVGATLLGVLGTMVRLSRLERRLADAPGPTAKEWDTLSRRLGTGVGSVQETTRRTLVRDIGALLTLHDVVDVRGETPAHAPWVAQPETVLALVGYVANLPDRAVVFELGSGLSTVWLALAADQQKRGIRIVSLDHDPEYADATRFALDRQGLADAVDLRVAPLEPVELGGDTYDWYGKSGWGDLKNIRLVFVDGPPGSTGSRARYPALPLLAPGLADGAVIVVDDTNRSDEKHIIQKWTTDALPSGRAHTERVLDHATVLKFEASGGRSASTRSASR